MFTETCLTRHTDRLGGVASDQGQRGARAALPRSLFNLPKSFGLSCYIPILTGPTSFDVRHHPGHFGMKQVEPIRTQ